MVHVQHTFLFAVVLLVCANTPVHAQDDRSKQTRTAFINGTSLQLQGRHAEAILEFQEALAADSSSSATLTAIARSYYELRKLDRAEAYIQKAIAVDPTSRESWELLAEVLIASGKYDEGVAAYEKILSLSPNQRHIYTLARLLEPRDARRAAELFEQYVHSNPDPEIYLRLDQLYIRLSDKTNRLRNLQSATRNYPDNFRLLSSLVEVLVESGQVLDAANLCRNYRTVAGNRGHSFELWTLMLQAVAQDSLVYSVLTDDVRVILDETLVHHHESYYSLFIAGNIALAMRDEQRARQLLEVAALQVGGRKSADAILRICTSYLIYGYPNLALDFALQHQPHFPTDARYHIAIAEAHIAMNQYEAAVTNLQNALELEPLVTDAWIQYGMVLDQLGRVADSDEAYRRALALDPQNVVAGNNYAYSLALRNRNLDTARMLAWNAVQQQPKNAAYLDTYAWVLFRSGELDRARTYIEMAVKYGGNATHYDHLGDILEAIGDIQGAVAAWQTALSKDADFHTIQSKINRYR